MGFGYVGLPTACVLANNGYSVLGVDIDKNVIRNIKSANYLNPGSELQNLLSKIISNNNIRFSANITPAEIYIITVPTPYK